MRIQFHLAAAALLALVVTSPAAAASPASEASRALEAWGPLDVVQHESAIIVTAKERRVSQKVFEAMMTAGLCAFVQAKLIELKGIEGVVVLNRFQHSGWVFEGGAALCRDVMAQQGKAQKIQLWGNVHVYARGLK